MIPENVKETVKDQLKKASITFEKIEAEALGYEVVQDILEKSVEPLVKDLNTAVKKYETGQNVDVTFVSKPSRKKPNVVRIGPIGKGWQAIHLIEFGTVERFKKSTGKSTGVMPAAGFMRSSVAHQRAGVVLSAVRLIQAAIKKSTKKHGLKSDK